MSILKPKHNISAAGEWIDWKRISEWEAIERANERYLAEQVPIFVTRKRKASLILVYRIGLDPRFDGRTPNATTPGPLAPIFVDGFDFRELDTGELRKE
jgi:hypothetical protein